MTQGIHSAIVTYIALARNLIERIKTDQDPSLAKD
jgi:hypothetical protein